MTIRRLIFWPHLLAGLAAGLVIVIMSVTGVLLTYERQLIAWSDSHLRSVPPAAGAARLPVEALLERLVREHPGVAPASVTYGAAPEATVAVAVPQGTLHLDAYSGQLLGQGTQGVRRLMSSLRSWHRWLAAEGEGRALARAITGWSNVLFLFLVVSGAYLWLPRVWRWTAVRSVLFFRGRLTGKARDFNWHNVIGLWTAPILIVLTLSAVPISFRWGNDLVYRLVGEEPPVRGPGAAATPAPELPPPPPGARPLSREAQFAAVQTAFPDFQQITLRLIAPGRGPGGAGPGPQNQQQTPPRAERGERGGRSGPQPLNFIVKLPGTWPRTATTTVTLNPFTGDFLRTEAFADLSAGRQIRSWTRFLHTGEALGFGGQFIAGLASLGGCFLTYTGFALAWRRFFRKKSATP